MTNAGNESRVSCLEGPRKRWGEGEPVTRARSLAGGQCIMELEGYPL